MGDNWTFQTQIALPLERYADTYLGLKISADDIGLGKFVEIMLKILSVSHIDPDEIKEFRRACKPYTGLSYTKIPDEVSQSLFAQFKDLMDLD